MVVFVPHILQGSVKHFVLSFEEGLQSLLVSEVVSVRMWRSLVRTVTPIKGNKTVGTDGWARKRDSSP